MKSMNRNREEGGLRLLALDTATANMSVALLEGGVTRKEIDTAAERNHSLYLLPSVLEALEDLGWTTEELQGIVVGRGPGSYTGVRIGVTAAKTLAWALRVPVAGVSTLEAMAGGACSAWSRESSRVSSREDAGSGVGMADLGCWVVPLMNARRGQAFTAWFEKSGSGEAAEDVFASGWSRRQEDGIRLMERWAGELLEELRHADRKPDTVLFTGETECFAELLSQFAAEAEELGIRTAVLPYGVQARYIGQLGALRFAAGDVDDVHGLLPNYTQLPEAEVRLLAATGVKK
ncbi:tRNA (adenosine(37)-N6)-threonylcarbamoyltransferase complex dimerization subunit type 1 TsaB [Gorillibacterium sp. sgz5001074]|uniref:tRNA (adenosine(37)-N6)-threonylcarbamoyltransferase complex dimerization subunit type 1 TsaB n=1 Tax=Gorillibacterium sp. sgz5001074 TaxID=3446695 RepID=UPI003F670DE5